MLKNLLMFSSFVLKLQMTIDERVYIFFQCTSPLMATDELTVEVPCKLGNSNV